MMRKATDRGTFLLGAAFLVAALPAFVLAACSGADDMMRPTPGAPAHFLVGRVDGGAPSEPVPDGLCHSPMVDPSDGTQLVMVHAAGGFADYEVPAGKYGVAEGEVLTIECGTGKPVGIHKRRE